MNTFDFIKNYLLERGFTENKNREAPIAKSFFLGKKFVEISVSGEYFDEIVVEVFPSTMFSPMNNHYGILTDDSTTFGTTTEELAEDLSKVITILEEQANENISYWCWQKSNYG